MEKYINCPICNSVKLKKKFEISYPNEQFNIFQCLSCKVQFVAEKLSPSYIEDFYRKPENSQDQTYTDGNVDNLDYYYNILKKHIEQKFLNKGKILDIGCSSGYFLDVMDGWDRYGVEISKQYADITKSKYKDKIFIGSFSDYTQNENFFDVITLQDCLDHMLNPVEVIKKCKYLLKPKGLLVVKVHNMDCLYAKLAGKYFYAFIPPTHLFYFNKKSLSVLFNKTGFKVISFNYFAHLLKIKTAFYRLSKGNNNIFYKISRYLYKTSIGDISFKKNLHDIVTVFAQKDEI